MRPQRREKGHLKISEKCIPRRRSKMCKALEAQKIGEYQNAVEAEKRLASSEARAEAKQSRALRERLGLLVDAGGGLHGGEQYDLIYALLLFAIPWTVAYQTPLSMEFSTQKYWGG